MARRGVKAAAEERPDLILMDVALGDMDGWEATQLIKAAPATADIPIIALTAHALASDRQKSIEVGCVEFETKPVDLPRLLKKITACLAHRDAARMGAGAEDAGANAVTLCATA